MKIKIILITILITVLIFILTSASAIVLAFKPDTLKQADTLYYNGDNNGVIALLKDYDFTNDFLISSSYRNIYYKHLSINPSASNFYAQFEVERMVDDPDFTLYPRIPNERILNAFLNLGLVKDAVDFQMNQILLFERPDFHLGYEYEKLANLYYRIGDYKDAFDFCKKSLVEENRMDGDALNTILAISLKVNDLDTANEIVKKMEAFNIDKDIPISFNLAYLYHKMGNYGEEELNYRRVLSLTQNHEPRARVYYNLGEYYSALDEINQAIAKRANCGDCYGLRSIIYRKLKRKSESDNDYFKATEINPNTFYTMAAKYFYNKDASNIQKAKEVLEEINNTPDLYKLYIDYDYPIHLTAVTVGVPQIFEE